ncbi:MAG TPA: RecX family transcriptional regulator [Gaiellaceae bacterium]|nr:RecX family transcriptional regulator [Gaiellaceae bacterium]HZT53315.1 RecX family transcriptional regulator [Gaiellaceae bacterium]
MARQQDAFAAVVAALERRDLTASELDQRLARAGYADEARADALERARRAGYLDDERVALERARRLADRCLSDAAIRADLERRGTPAELVEAALAATGDEQARADRLVLAGKVGGGARAARALARRGFSPETVERALGRAVAEPL